MIAASSFFPFPVKIFRPWFLGLWSIYTYIFPSVFLMMNLTNLFIRDS